MSDLNVHEAIRERFSKLPKELREAITSVKVAESLRKISEENRLHLDQGQILENETYMVLLGIDEASNYAKNIQKELSVPEEQAQKIANEVVRNIFSPIREGFKAHTLPQNREAGENVKAPDPEDKNREVVKIASPRDINKLNTIVKNTNREMSVEGKSPHYVTDPYREPIE